MAQFYYFTGCCGTVSPFGILSGSTAWTNFVDTVGTTYSVVVGPFSGCVTYSGSANSTQGRFLYTQTPTFSASTCVDCIEAFPCYTPTPTVTPVISAYQNECGIITILPMGVECVKINPSSNTSSDGQVSLLITGGTPPYNVTWLNNGQTTSLISGLKNGSYTAVTTDYYQDFTATTVCDIFTEKDCTFSGAVYSYIPTSPPVDGYFYTVRITGGTSPGPYSIYYNGLPGTRDSFLTNLAYLYPSTTEFATGLTLSQLTASTGVNIIITEVTSSIYLYNELCGTYISLIPPITIVYQDFCLFWYPNDDENSTKYLHFTQSGFDSNNNPIWVYDNDPTVTVTWSSTRWVLNNYQYDGSRFYSLPPSDVNSNPPLNWDYAGGGTLTVGASVGPCNITGRSALPVSINQPTCSCDGSIMFNVNLDNPPFNYSIDNGVSYSTSPIFTSLCSGLYNLYVVDSSGNTYNKTITLNKPELPTTYTVSLFITDTTPVSNNISLVKSYETNVIVDPPLPDGAYVTFDITHNNSFYSSPTSGTSLLTTSTVLTKNTSGITLNSVVTGNTQLVNTINGCQTEYVYQSDLSENWYSLTLTNADTMVINTTTRVDKTSTGQCVIGYSDDTYSISNISIKGCDCCTLIINI
jgi:hypothetical protein